MRLGPALPSLVFQALVVLVVGVEDEHRRDHARDLGVVGVLADEERLALLIALSLRLNRRVTELEAHEVRIADAAANALAGDAGLVPLFLEVDRNVRVHRRIWR